MKNQSAVLTSSTVRQWVATLKVEEFLAGKSKPASQRKSRATHSNRKSTGHRGKQAA